MSSIQTFDISLNTDIFSIGIKKSLNEKKEDAIIFTCYCKNHISNASYKSSFTLEQLVKIASVFKLCNNIDQALDIIIKTFNNKEVKLFKDETIYLVISKDEIKIGLEKVLIHDSAIVENICENLSKIQDKNKELEEEIKLLKAENEKINEKLNKTVPETLLDVISKRFTKSKYLLLNDLNSHLEHFNLQEGYLKEIMKQFNSKAEIIYDVKKHGDTLVSFMARVFGRKNIATFHALYEGQRYLNVQLAYLHGKLEFNNNFFNFEQNDLFTYGNYQVYEGDFCFTSFRAQNSKLYVKIEFDCIYVIFYEGENINFVAKIRDNFMNNPALYIDGYDAITSFFENNPEDKVGELFNINPGKEVNLSELIIYQIGEP
jgi:hypothetical protein